MKNIFCELLGNDDASMFLIYTDSKVRASIIKNKAINAVYECDGLEGYMIGLTSYSYMEEMFYEIKMLDNHTNLSSLKPVGVVFTTWVINTGLDVSRMEYLLIYDMPQSLIHTYQEIGRVGHRLAILPHLDMVDILVQSTGYRFLAKRIKYPMNESSLPKRAKKGK